jgi:hypothetical protein
MSNNRRYPSRLVRASLLVAPVLAAMLLAAPATAQKLVSEGPQPSDPVLQMGEWSAGPNHFFINNNQDVELIRFKTAHQLEMCAARGYQDVDGRVPGYPLQVTYDSATATIAPGNCLSFGATRVQVRAASALPQDIILEGAYRVVK